MSNDEQTANDATQTQAQAQSQGGLRALRPLRPLRRAIPTFRSRSGRIQPPSNAPYRGRPVHLVVSAVVLTVLVTLIMSVPLLPGQVELQPGTPAPQDIYSPIFLRYESSVLTQEARDKAS